MRESSVEKRLKTRLEQNGFKVLKLVTQGTAGAPDRMILCPTWSPGPPYFVELKRPGKDAERLQELTHLEWRKRGVQVLDVCDSYSRVEEILTYLLDRANERILDTIAVIREGAE